MTEQVLRRFDLVLGNFYGVGGKRFDGVVDRLRAVATGESLRERLDANDNQGATHQKEQASRCQNGLVVVLSEPVHHRVLFSVLPVVESR